MARLTIEDSRFWARVDKADSCWKWSGARNRDGYGFVRRQESFYLAHRWAWTITYGPIPKGMGVLHRCDNPPCVNPSHLFLGDPKANAADRASKGRNAKNAGERHGQAKLNLRSVGEIRGMYSRGATCRELAALFRISKSQIHNVVTGKRWSNG